MVFLLQPDALIPLQSYQCSHTSDQSQGEGHRHIALRSLKAWYSSFNRMLSFLCSHTSDQSWGKASMHIGLQSLKAWYSSSDQSRGKAKGTLRCGPARRDIAPSIECSHFSAATPVIRAGAKLACTLCCSSRRHSLPPSTGCSHSSAARPVIRA